MKRKLLTKSSVASMGVGLALVAGIFSTPFLNANATSTATGILIWDCNGRVCYHEYNDIEVDDDNPPTNFYHENTATDQGGTENKFSVVNNSSKNVDFIDKDDFDSWQADYKDYKGLTGAVDWSIVKASTVLYGMARDYEEQFISDGTCDGTKTQQEIEACVNQNMPNNIPDNLKFGISLQPIWGKNGAHSWMTFADHNFKVLIYDDKFAGLSLGSMSSLTYVPKDWDATQYADSIDISDTTIDNPVVFESVLIEPTVKIKSSGYNNVTFSSIEAVNAPSDAYEATVSSSGLITLTFNSNFYDREVFKITDTNSNNYYIRIARFAVEAETGVDQSGTLNSDLSAIMYFDDSKTCGNYEVIAVIEYKNGTKRRIKLDQASSYEDDLGQTQTGCKEDYNATGHSGLSRGHYEKDLSSYNRTNVAGIYFYGQKTGSSSSTYAGSYAGSGLGLYYEMDYDEGHAKINWDK